MPIYEYQCQRCGYRHEALQKVSDEPLRDCPACQSGSLKKLVSVAGFRLSGSGWYETDFKSDNKKNLARGDSRGDAKGDSTAGSRGNAGEGAEKSNSAQAGTSDKADAGKKSASKKPPRADSHAGVQAGPE